MHSRFCRRRRADPWSIPGKGIMAMADNESERRPDNAKPPESDIRIPLIFGGVAIGGMILVKLLLGW